LESTDTYAGLDHIGAVTAAYEAWLRTQCAVVEKDLGRKHALMRKAAFPFLRATYYRWASTIEALLPELAGAPEVLAVGDSHVENFGTWRDAEGRPVWGVNDFDETASMPWPFDLVRLAASARLAPGIAVSGREAAAAILDGYRNGIEAPRATLLDEHALALRPLVACTDEQRARFWTEIAALPAAAPPDPPRSALLAALPEPDLAVRFAARIAGAGSLGRPRFVAVAPWRGGGVVREAKAMIPSAWDWAHGRPPQPGVYMALATGPFRAPDPWLACREGWVIRRIAPDSRKAELLETTRKVLRAELLRAMGRELGTLHAASPGRTAIRASLDTLPAAWLRDAGRRTAAAVTRDWEAWRRSG